MRQQQLKPEHWITIMVFGLVIMGVAILSSASAIIAYRHFGNNDYYLWQQVGNLFLGMIGFFVFRYIPYRIWMDYAPLILIGTVGLLIAVFIPGIGAEYGTAHSWIDLPSPLPNIQPSEYAKLGISIYLAYYFSKKKELITDFKEGFLPFVAIVALICGLVAIQPDFGTTLILGAIAGVMFFLAGGHIYHILLSVFAAIFVGFIAAMQRTYIFDRFTSFIDPFQDELGAGYHIIQSLVAVGSGGFWGKGFGASRFKYEGYLPEAQGDSIFAIAAEELGFIRVAIIVFAFFVIAWQGIKVAERTQDLFGKYLATGITVWIWAQSFINMMVVLSLFPTTGVPLPFISYGGSSLLALMIGVGLLLNIAYHDPKQEHHLRRGRNSRAHSAKHLSHRSAHKKSRR